MDRAEQGQPELLGILLIAGGWVMERTRRRLVACVAESAG